MAIVTKFHVDTPGTVLREQKLFKQLSSHDQHASSVSILFCDMERESTLTALNSRGQGHLVTFPKGHLG